MTGKTILHYRIIEELGRGGMGVVYKARDTRLERDVALKFLSPHLTQDAGARARFIQEAQAASALEHPNLCTIYSIDEAADGQTFICMAYYQGETLQAKIAASGNGNGSSSGSGSSSGIEIAEAVDIATQIAAGLARAHEAGIIHRDIKPSNIIVTDRGEVKILDFGIAKLAGQAKVTRTGATLGTVAYISPEQLQNQPVDHRTDIWSLGVVLYEMLTGQVPFRGEIEQATMFAIVSDDPAPLASLNPDVPAALEAVVSQALAKECDARYQRMDEVRTDLKHVQRGGNLMSLQPPAQPLQPPKRRAHLIGGAIALVVLLAALGSFLWLSRGFERPPVSIAVLPVEKITPETEQWFLDGVHGELINALQNIGGMRVISRSTMLAFESENKTIPEVAAETDASHIIETSASRIGNELRVSVRLIDGPKDEVLWSKSFVRGFANFHALQTEIARGIADEAHVKLAPGEMSRLAESQAVAEQAVEAYLRGRFEWAKRTNESLEQAIEYFNQALAIEPAYAKAYAGMADAYILAGIGYANFISRDDGFALARENALKALAIDSALAEAYVPWAQYEWRVERNQSDAEKLLQRAIALNPSYATAYEYYGAFFLMDQRRFDEALEALRKAESLDPLSLSIKLGIGWIFERSQEFDKAIAQYQSIIEMDPSFFMGYYNLGFVYNAIGRHTQAIPVLEKAHSINATFFVKGQLGYAYAKSGHHARAVEIRDELLQSYEQGNIREGPIAWIYLGLGDYDEALTWLEKSAARRGRFTASNNFDQPQWDPVRSNPRFVKLFEMSGSKK